MKEILIFSPLPVSAGSGSPQRYKSIAQVLSGNGFKVNILYPGIKSHLKKWFHLIVRSKYLLLPPSASIFIFFILRLFNKIIVTDHYAPDFLETYDKFRSDGPLVSWLRYKITKTKLSLLLSYSNVVLVSTPQEALFLKGVCYSQGLLTRKKYLIDSRFDHLFPLVPYGFEIPDLSQSTSIGKRYFPTLDFKIPVLAWGGGLWNWFNPFSLVRVLAKLRDQGIEVKILFPNPKDQNPAIPGAGNTHNFLKAIEENKLDKYVVFAESWIPYPEYVNILSLCRAGLSIASDSIESTLAFRTRIISYIAAQIPTICTKGDYLSEVVEKKNLGFVIPSEDDQELETAIKTVIKDSQTHKEFVANVARIQPSFTWNVMTLPLVHLLQKDVPTERIGGKRLFILRLLNNLFLKMVFWIADIKGIRRRMRKLFSGA